ncbi:alpha/beta hydrolase [Glutamicibacter sp.]|uniref:alpha/beta hydrolase n=1 Tax=Glutamicibacter sp. TaxID=1931995 RepID=UPI003D6AA8D2
MNPTDTRSPISLDRVHPEARELLAAFRQAGARSFNMLTVSEARAKYESTCQANGLARLDLPLVQDLGLDVPGGRITLRHYSAGNTTPGSALRPVILFIHGGGWVFGSLETHDALARSIAVHSGADVVSVAYRLAPEYRYPVPLDDCRAAFSFVAQRSEDFGWDANRIGVLGDSAGGAMAAALANNPGWWPDGAQVRAAALLYPVTDLSRESASYAAIEQGFPLTAGSMRWFAGHYLAEPGQAHEPTASPLLADLAGTVPPATLVITVGFDPLADEGIAYAGALARAGAKVEHHHLAGFHHGLFTSAGKIPTGAAYTRLTGDWLGKALGRGN